MVCWYWNKPSHYQDDCYEWKCERDKNGGRDNCDTSSVMVAMLDREDPNDDLWLIACHISYVDSIETAHILKDEKVLSDDKILVAASIYTARAESVTVTSLGSLKTRHFC